MDELLKIFVFLSVFLGVLIPIFSVVFFRLGVKLGGGLTDSYGGERGAFQAVSSEPEEDVLNHGAHSFADLDAHISRSLKQMGASRVSTLLDPVLAGKTPSQAAGGDR